MSMDSVNCQDRTAADDVQAVQGIQWLCPPSLPYLDSELINRATRCGPLDRGPRYSSPWTVSWASAETLGLPTKAIPQPHQHLSQPLQPASYSADLIRLCTALH